MSQQEQARLCSNIVDICDESFPWNNDTCGPLRLFRSDSGAIAKRQGIGDNDGLPPNRRRLSNSQPLFELPLPFIKAITLSPRELLHGAVGPYNVVTPTDLILPSFSVSRIRWLPVLIRVAS